MAITPQQQSHIITLTVGMFNAAPGARYLSEFATLFENSGNSYLALAQALAGTQQYQSQFTSGMALDARIDSVLGRLGIQTGSDAYTIAKAHFDARVVQGASEPELMVEALEYLLGNNAAPAFASVQAQLNNKVAVATFYSVEKQLSDEDLAELQAVLNQVTEDAATVEAAKAQIIGNGEPGNNDGGSGSNSGTGGADNSDRIFNLTVGVDVYQGGPGNDTFIAGLDNASATLTPGDMIDGGEGIDRINLIGNANTAAFAGASIKHVEHVYAQFEMPKSVYLPGPPIIVPGPPVLGPGDPPVLIPGPPVTMPGAPVLVPGTPGQLNVSGNTDVQHAWISGGYGGTVALTKTQAAGIEGTVAGLASTFLFSDASSGAVDDVASLALNGANTQAGGVHIANINTLNIAAQGRNVLGTVDATALTAINLAGQGAVTATFNGNNINSVDASGTTGGVKLTLGASAFQHQVIKGGAGNDVITTSLAGLTSDDTIDLGEGVNALIFNDAASIVTGEAAGKLANVLNVAKLGSVDKKLTVDSDWVTQDIFTTRGSGSLDIRNATDTTTLEFGGGVVRASTVTMKQGASVLQVELNGELKGAEANVAAGLTVNGSQTVNIASNGSVDAAANQLALYTFDNSLNVVITGSQALTLTTGVMNGGATIDSSAATGNLNITGTDRPDTFVVGKGAHTLTGGAGNDTFDFSLTENGSAAIVGRANMNTITDYNLGDILKFAGVTSLGYMLQMPSVTTLEEALGIVDTGVKGQVSAFSFGGDTYVLTQLDDTVNDQTGDTLVKLAGVSGVGGMTLFYADHTLMLSPYE